MDSEDAPTAALIAKDKNKNNTRFPGYNSQYSTNKNYMGKFADNGPRGKGFSNFTDPYRVGTTNTGVGGGNYNRMGSSGAGGAMRKGVSTAVKTRVRK